MKLAIIGASVGQLPLCLKAKEMGLTTICFAWEEGAICKSYVDKFYPISVLEKDKIVELCRKEKIHGVVSNASDLLAEVVAYVAEELDLLGNPYSVIRDVKNKLYVREKSLKVEGLSRIKFERYKQGDYPTTYPCIVKPVIGASKKGVFCVYNNKEFLSAISAIKSITNEAILLEEYVEGVEVSVESISYNGEHYVLQVTDKVNSGAPHFVELEHHQPSELCEKVEKKVRNVAVNLLSQLGYENGASHIEFKITADNKIYLIEINPRGGGDEISSKLVCLSTGYDYLKGIIEIAINRFDKPLLDKKCFSGIYYLCEQTKYLQPFFNSATKPIWLVEKSIVNDKLIAATGNYDRNGFFIYQWTKKVSNDEIVDINPFL